MSSKDLENAATNEVPRRRGFATMDRAQVSAIARMGGRAAHRAGTAHRFSSEEAAAAGRKGGRTRRERRDAPVVPVEKLDENTERP